MTPLEQMLELALAGMPNEVCGLMVARGKKCLLLPAKNLADSPKSDFVLDPACWLEVLEGDEVVGIYHSHPVTNAQPSMHDLVMCERTALPWHIVNPTTQEHVIVNPSGYLAPYVRRPYVHGVLDCYSVCKDWYEREWSLALPDVNRDPEWWLKGQSLYLDHFSGAGFVRLAPGTPHQVGDGLLIQEGSPVPNHAAVYVGDGAILHHVRGRLSCIEAYTSSRQRQTTHHLRHQSRIANA